MGRLVKTAIALAVVLAVLFAGAFAYKRLTGKSSVADNQPPLSSWKTLTVGSFSVKLPHQPKQQTGAPGGVSTTLLSLSADVDSLVVSVSRPSASPTLDALVHSTATASNVQVASTTRTTIGGKPAEVYRCIGTAGDQPVSAFGAAFAVDGSAIVIQYDVAGHPAQTPAFLTKVLGTVTFSGT